MSALPAILAASGPALDHEPVDDPDNLHASCSACGGPLVWLGQLGRRWHARCRNCGLMHSEVE